MSAFRASLLGSIAAKSLCVVLPPVPRYKLAKAALSLSTAFRREHVLETYASLSLLVKIADTSTFRVLHILKPFSFGTDVLMIRPRLVRKLDRGEQTTCVSSEKNRPEM